MEERILSILIVDDEDLIRQDLKMMPWENMGSVLVGEASDGQEALEFCSRFTPDVVITDITMPVMGGLELFDSLKKKYPCIQTIILSCHSEFKYAKEALKLGAVDYLLKAGLSVEEMQNALEKARKEIQKEGLRDQSIKASLRSELSRLFMQATRVQELDAVELAENSWKKGLNTDSFKTFSALYILAKPENILFMENEIHEILDKYEKDFIWLKVGLDFYLIIFNNPRDLKNESILIELVETLYEQIGRKLSFANGKARYFVYLNETVTDEKMYFKLLHQEAILKDIGFYDEKNLLFKGEPWVFNKLDEGIKRDFEENFYNNRIYSVEGIEDIKQTFMEWSYHYRITTNDLKWLVIDWIRKMENASDNMKTVTMRIWQSTVLSELFEAVLHEAEMRQKNRIKYRTEIRKAIEIIKKRLDQSLKLSDIANEVGFSSFHFSRIFNEEVGESFINYITRVRIEKAVYLLQNSNLKVYEVAEAVGIPNYRYFSSVFKNLTGFAPKDMKRGGHEDEVIK